MIARFRGGSVAWIAGTAVLFSTACTSEKFSRFPHEPHTSKGFACTTCHEGVLDKSGKTAALPGQSKCLSCHKRAHRKEKYKQTCDECHFVIHREARLGREREAPLAIDHPKHVARNRGQCFPCHANVVSRPTHAERLRPTMNSCFSCHNHKKQWDNLECNACHMTLTHYRLKPVSAFAHEGGFIRQHGKIARNRGEFCSQCHTQSYCATTCHDPSEAVFKPSVRRPDAIENGFIHRGDFVARHPIEARGSGDTCVRCHSQKECRNCHEKSGVGAGSGRSPHPAGWVSVSGGSNLHGRSARREIVACAGCHDKGASSNCVLCHRVGGVGGSPHPPGWKSRLSKQGDRVCRICH